MDQVQAAKSFATLHHVIRKGQLYGVLPYTHHLQDVANVLKEFGENSPEMQVVAWLHDIIEDTDVKAKDIEENFGTFACDLVVAVTSEKGENRKVRNALTYPKIRACGELAVRLKLADRIANVRNGGALVKMYAKEYPDFRHGLTMPGESDGKGWNTKMWAHLDTLLLSSVG